MRSSCSPARFRSQTKNGFPAVHLAAQRALSIRVAQRPQHIHAAWDSCCHASCRGMQPHIPNSRSCTLLGHQPTTHLLASPNPSCTAANSSGPKNSAPTLCCRMRPWPTPRSFHSPLSLSNRYSLHLLRTGAYRQRGCVKQLQRLAREGKVRGRLRRLDHRMPSQAAAACKQPVQGLCSSDCLPQQRLK